MAEEMSIQQYIQKHSEKDAFATVMFVYQSALIQMRSRIDVLNNELSQVYSYNPIEYVKTRLKTPESIMQKLRKQGHSFNVNDLIEYIHDIAGIRITCSFFSEVYFLSDMIAKQDNLEVLSIKDYIKNPKESGYMSYHMLLSIPVALADAVVPAKVELQIRTMAMDFWASLEHKIYYKYEGNAPDYFERELQECASIISRLDTKMMSLNEAMKKIDGDGHIRSSPSIFRK